METSTPITLFPSNWQTTNAVTTLTDGTHIWAIKLNQAPNYQANLYGWLSAREKSKTQRMLIGLKRDYQIQAKGWLRWLLAQYTNSSPDQISYRYGSLGKPYLDSTENQIYFNATDSGNTLLCAFSQKHELGIDIEAMPRTVNYKRIAEKKYTDHEQQTILSLPTTRQCDGFLALWTRKEAFGKALGVGIRYSMNKFNLCDDFNSYRYGFVDEETGTWNFFQFTNANNIACLTSRQNHEKINFYQLDIDSISFANEF